MSWDPRWDAWAAGFIDGEGCFLLADRPAPQLGRPSVTPLFTVALRADDRPILDELARGFGGRVDFKAVTNGDRSGANPRYTWVLARKQDLRRLVAYLDCYPLRAKKARDYAIWRQAVMIYLRRGGRQDYVELLALRDALSSGRAYRSTHEPRHLRAVG